MFADYHLHCEFSDDSMEPLENQVERAISLGMDEMCFTDHVDYGIKKDWDDPAGVEYRITFEHGRRQRQPLANVDYPAYFSKIDKMKEIYGDKINIKKGLEFGIQSHTVPQYQDLYKRYEAELDFVLFSMHQVRDLEFWTQDFQKGRSQKEYNDEYYKEIYETMKLFKDYSVLAHLDLLARYDPNGSYPFEKEKDIIAEILRLAINDGKGIEINTSSWKYGLSDTQPSRAILHLYKDLGGEIITIGSDAHTTKQLGGHFADAVAILRDEIGMKAVCTYEHMKPVFHDLG